MKRILIAGMLLWVITAAHAVDVEQCRTLFKKAGENPYRLTLAELDEVRLCGAGMYAARVNEQQTAKEMRAIDHNFSRQVRRDSE